ncbi:MAG: Ribosomal protein L18, bacterial [Parcubacteria group bacterium GW2011_GWC2_45_7]|nr:MAG: Ribosomal protein L18, bacterial [Parcubacteria group bacterium GW2011_GWC2_45_7]KKU73522.1 MAG: Ribosomal protein L18, bacterial [Parcubacteria group bacterium GW2011_GWA2_47_26]
MKETLKDIKKTRVRRQRRVRASMRSNALKPRMSVHVSGQHLYIQFIDDEKGVTLLAVSDALVKGDKKTHHVTVEVAKELGKKAAELAKAKNIETVVFDRGRRAYHGRVRAVAEGAREGGLIF